MTNILTMFFILFLSTKNIRAISFGARTPPSKSLLCWRVMHNRVHRRNQVRFKNHIIHWKLILSNIISSVSMSGNNTTKVSSPDMREFVILKSFRVVVYPPKPPTIKEFV